jgi:outer membrane protein assembly factor BamB
VTFYSAAKKRGAHEPVGTIGKAMAFDAKSGKNLWHFQTGTSLYAGVMTYMVDGRQYVLMPAGTTLTAFALAEF